jgi:hypothetical protein
VGCWRHMDLSMKKTLLIFHFFILALAVITGDARAWYRYNPMMDFLSNGQHPDTMIQGIHIQFTFDPTIFPESWRDAPINAWGESIGKAEVLRTKTIVSQALKKYPAPVLMENLKSVFFLKSMKFFDVGYGGTNSTDAVYLTNNGISMGYTDSYIERTFHHEFSSILFRNFISRFDTVEWKKANIMGFDYNDPENGVGAIRNNQSSQEPDSVLCKKGFLTQYAVSSLENDVNTLSQNLFLPTPGFWDLVDKYPRIRKKMNILLAFYKKLDPLFTENYFRNFKPG